VIAVFNAVFRSTISCSRPEIFAIKARNPKFWSFWAPNFFGGGTPKFLTKFKKLQSPPNTWQSLVMIGPWDMSVPKVDRAGRIQGPIFRRLWTKVHQIWYTRRGVIAVFNTVFRSTISCSRPEIFAIKSRNLEFWCFWAPKFWGEGPPNFWLTFKNYSHHRTCGKVWWRSAQRPPRLDGEKKDDRNISSKI